MENSTIVFPVTRRQFLGRCAACAAMMPFLSAISFGMEGFFRDITTRPFPRPRIKVIYAYPDPGQPNWPNIGYDFEGKITEIKGKLGNALPFMDFEHVSTMDGTAENGKKLLADRDTYDGYLVYLVGCLWGDLTETIASCGKPVILVDHLFAGSGEFLTSYARVKKQGYPVVGISSSDFADVVKALKCFQVMSSLRASTVLVVGAEADPAIREFYGTNALTIPFEEINKQYAGVSKDESGRLASEWIHQAEKVVEPTEEEIIKSAAMAIAMRKLMDDHEAQAVTINCLGGIYSGQMVEAYPCLGFMKLDDEGLVGACEADQRSTMTKLVMTYLVSRPGFISDPVIDTAKNQIIYSHCVAPTRVYGYYGPVNPFHIRSHSEDRRGACNRSLMPLGEMTTTLLFDHHRKQVIFHQGVTVENVDDDKACRNKLAVEVKGDIHKLMEYWDEWGWHRVTFFGDLKNEVFNYAALAGFKVIEEA
jgi:hypothetical protein